MYNICISLLFFYTEADVSDHICDVICEKVPYSGTKSVILDQLFSHVRDTIYGLYCTGSDKSVFCRCSWATNIIDPDQTAPLSTTSGQALRYCSIIRQVFADEGLNEESFFPFLSTHNFDLKWHLQTLWIKIRPPDLPSIWIDTQAKWL